MDKRPVLKSSQSPRRRRRREGGRPPARPLGAPDSIKAATLVEGVKSGKMTPKQMAGMLEPTPEELAELRIARGDAAGAAPLAAKAYALLREDAWLAATEPARLERLAKIGAGEVPAPPPTKSR